MPVSCNYADHVWGIVDLSVSRKVMSVKMKASGKPYMPVGGCVLFEAFFCPFRDVKAIEDA